MEMIALSFAILHFKRQDEKGRGIQAIVACFTKIKFQD